MRTLAEYERFVEALRIAGDVDRLTSELLERMRVNVGLVAENDGLRRRVQTLEEGGPPRAMEDPHVLVAPIP